MPPSQWSAPRARHFGPLRLYVLPTRTVIKKLVHVRSTYKGNPSPPRRLDVPGDEVADGGLELGSREVREQRWPLACGSIPQHHEEEAHHCQTAVLDLTQLHVVPLLQLTKA